MDPQPPKSAHFGAIYKVKNNFPVFFEVKSNGYSWNGLFILFCYSGHILNGWSETPCEYLLGLWVHPSRQQLL